jgi:hypothetical protein
VLASRAMLRIEPIIRQAEEIATRVETQMPTHPGLLRTARMTAKAARDAEALHKRMKRLFGLHRLPAGFLLLATGVLLCWAYWHFLHTSTVVVAISESDAVDLGQQLGQRVQFVQVKTTGSRESLARLQRREVDMAFVQGGIAIPPELPRIELPDQEVLLLLLRSRIEHPWDIRTVLTSSEGQGSHAVAQHFAKHWGIEGSVRYVHEWKALVGNPAWQIPQDVDAVLVVKDPLDRRIVAAVHRLLDNGFRMVSADLGAAGFGLAFLTPVQLTAGYFDPAAAIPPEPLSTYAVKTYLAARTDLSPRQFAAARRLVDPSANVMDTRGTMSSIDEASELLQGVEAFLGILVYIGLAVIALLGVDVMLYRARFHELNSLISLVSMHQASKDVLGSDPASKASDIAYLRYCSDLLGLISAITGYYAQENSSLMYNKLLEVIPQRADSLKLNIQIKILHALVDVPHLPQAAEEPSSSVSE